MAKIAGKKFLVVNEAKQLIGAIATEDLKPVPTSEWNNTRIIEIIQPLETVNAVPADLSLLEVVQQIETEKVSELAVIRKDGVVVGLLDKDSILSLMEKEAQNKMEAVIVDTEINKPETTYIN